MISVLIVEDDPMVAEFNKRYLEQINGFSLAGIAHSVTEAIDLLKEVQVNLVLLDIYMPGKTGLDLLNYIREQNKGLDVILITAASDADKIQRALRYGAIDYLVKPFEFERFQYALLKYKESYNLLKNKDKVKQEEVDQLLSKGHQAGGKTKQVLPKGLTNSTLKLVANVIKSIDEGCFSTDAVATKTDISRVSIRKYLKFLKDINVLEESLTYGVGRPVYLYSYNKKNESKLNKYL